MPVINGCRVSAQQTALIEKMVPSDRRIANINGHWILVEIVKDRVQDQLKKIRTVYPCTVAALQQKKLIRPVDTHWMATGSMYDLTWEAYSHLTGYSARN